MSVWRDKFRAGVGVACVALFAAGGRAADPLEDLEAQYQAALAALRKPPIMGLLITEVPPESPAAAAGMRAGDVITEYYGTRVSTIEGLAEQVAEAVARRIEDETAGKKVMARVRRGAGDVLVQLPREALGLRLVEVQAGVPGPRNVPPNVRGTLTLDWKGALQALREDGRQSAFAALERTEGVVALRQVREAWNGWMVCALTPEGDTGLGGTVERFVPLGTVAADGTPATERAAFTFHLMTGDYTSAPAFVVDAAGATYPAGGPERTTIKVAATRQGERFQTTVSVAEAGTLADARAQRREHAAPLSAVPQAALPWIAAAMPQSEGDALGVYLLSEREFLPRPGYVLVTRGRQALPAEPAGDGVSATNAAAALCWRVDLTHFGVVIESYWFTDQRRLMCILTAGPQAQVLRRAQDVRAASVPQDRKTATAPTTRP